MPWVTVRVPRTFVPGEAYAIAAGFRTEANRARALATQLREVGGGLESTWEGNAKNTFMNDFRPEPGNVESYAAWLEAQAQSIEHMTVTVWESKLIRTSDK